MLTHFGNFLCSLGGKGPFKTNAALWSVALARLFILFFKQIVGFQYCFTQGVEIFLQRNLQGEGWGVQPGFLAVLPPCHIGVAEICHLKGEKSLVADVL